MWHWRPEPDHEGLLTEPVVVDLARVGCSGRARVTADGWVGTVSAVVHGGGRVRPRLESQLATMAMVIPSPSAAHHQ